MGDLQSVIARVRNGRVPGKNCLVSKHEMICRGIVSLFTFIVMLLYIMSQANLDEELISVPFSERKKR